MKVICEGVMVIWQYGDARRWHVNMFGDFTINVGHMPICEAYVSIREGNM